MAAPTNLFQNVVVKWAIPAGITSAVYDTTNIYSSSTEGQQYTLLASIPFLDLAGSPQTSYTDATRGLVTKDTVFYMVVFSHSTSGALSDSYLAYKALSPREQRLVYQIRDALSQFVTNTLADEEVRMYLEQGLQGVNMYSPTTDFTTFTMPASLEPLVLWGAIIFGASQNMMRIGFTDIQYSDQGWSLTANRMDKMGATFDRLIKAYNEMLALAKLDYASGPTSIGTLMMPLGLSGKIGPVLEAYNALGSSGR